MSKSSSKVWAESSNSHIGNLFLLPTALEKLFRWQLESPHRTSEMCLRFEHTLWTIIPVTMSPAARSWLWCGTVRNLIFTDDEVQKLIPPEIKTLMSSLTHSVLKNQENEEWIGGGKNSSAYWEIIIFILPYFVYRLPHTRNMCGGARGQFAGFRSSTTMWVSGIKCRCQAVGKCPYPLGNLASSLLRTIKSILKLKSLYNGFSITFLKEWTLEGRRMGGWIWEEFGGWVGNEYDQTIVYIQGVLKEIIN